MDKTKKRVREHAEKHGMSYQAAWNQLEGGHASTPAPLEFWDWMDHVNGPARSRCLTIADVTAMREGETVQLLIMDRNLCDHVYPGHGRALRPKAGAEDFFSVVRDGGVYTHGDGLTGRMLWGWDTEAKRAHEAFTFEVEYSPNHWHPLVDGRLPTREWFHDLFQFSERQLDELLEETYPGLVPGLAWQEMPPDTRVGWRGPAMRWRTLGEMPPVFVRIDLERLMIEGVMPSVRTVLNAPEERAMWLQHVPEGWQLAVEGLTDAEREEMQRLFRDVAVVPGQRRFGVTRVGKRTSPEIRRRLLEEYLSSPGGRRKLAAAIKTPLEADAEEGLEAVARMFSVAAGDMADEMTEVLALIEWPEGVEVPTYEEMVDRGADVASDEAELRGVLGDAAEMYLPDDEILGGLQDVLTDEEHATALRQVRGLDDGELGLRTLAQMIQAVAEQESGISEERRRWLVGETVRRVAEDSGLAREAVEELLGHLTWPEGVVPLTVNDVLGD